MLRQEKGITLIALVITIIVLLILAGVTIAMLTGENGILTRASDSKVASVMGDAKDMVSLKASDAVAEYYNTKYVNGTTVSADSATAYVIEKVNGMTVTGATVTATGTKITITYTADSNVKSEGTVTDNGGISWTDTWKATTSD